MDISAGNCHGSKMYHYSTVSKCEKTTSIYPSQGRFGIMPGPLRPHTNCSFVSLGYHIPPFWNILHLASFTPPELWSAAHLPSQEVEDFSPCFAFSHTDFASTYSQSAGKCQAGIGKMSFYIPDSVIVAYGALLIHKESPRSIFCQFLWLKWKTEANFQSVSAHVPLNSWLVSLFGFDKHNLISAGISLPAQPTYCTISFCVCARPQFDHMRMVQWRNTLKLSQVSRFIHTAAHWDFWSSPKSSNAWALLYQHCYVDAACAS